MGPQFQPTSPSKRRNSFLTAEIPLSSHDHNASSLKDEHDPARFGLRPPVPSLRLDTSSIGTAATTEEINKPDAPLAKTLEKLYAPS